MRGYTRGWPVVVPFFMKTHQPTHPSDRLIAAAAHFVVRDSEPVSSLPYPSEQFGLAVVRLRRQRGLSRQELADAARLALPRLMALEMGGLPLAEVLPAIPGLAAALGRSPAQLGALLLRLFEADDAGNEASGSLTDDA